MKKISCIIFLLLVLVLIPIKVSAESDIASGVYENVPWRITSGHVLILGEDNRTYTISAPAEVVGEHSWPWEYSNNKSYYDKVYSIEVKGHIIGAGSLAYMFNFGYCEQIDVKNLDTSAVTNMSYMFWDCENLTELDLSSFDTRNVKSMDGMFETCTSLKTINLSSFDTRNVNSMRRMFEACHSLKTIDLSSFDTRNVNSMDRMFANCNSIKTINLSSFDTSKVRSMIGFFRGCESIEAIDISRFDTSNVEWMGKMFKECISLKHLDLSNIDTSSVKDMNEMFRDCASLESLDLSSFDTKNVNFMDDMFYGCASLESLDLSSFDTKNVNYMDEMFCGCASLKSLDLSNIDLASVKSEDSIEEGNHYHEYHAHNLIYSTNPQILKTPLNVKETIELPFDMYDLQGQIYSELPQNLSYSITLYKSKQLIPANNQPVPSSYGNAANTNNRNSLFGVNLSKVSKGKKSFTAKWKKASKMQQKEFSGYQIQYSITSDFSRKVKTKSTTKKNASRVVIRKLKKKTTYYVRIRRFKKSGGKKIYSDWSSVKRVKTA